MVSIGAEFFKSNFAPFTDSKVNPKLSSPFVPDARSANVSTKDEFQSFFQDAFKTSRSDRKPPLQEQKKTFFNSEKEREVQEKDASHEDFQKKELKKEDFEKKVSNKENESKEVSEPLKKKERSQNINEEQFEKNETLNEGINQESDAKQIFYQEIAIIYQMTPEEVEKLLESEGDHLEKILEKIPSEKWAEFRQMIRDFLKQKDGSEEGEFDFQLIEKLLEESKGQEVTSNAESKLQKSLRETVENLPPKSKGDESVEMLTQETPAEEESSSGKSELALDVIKDQEDSDVKNLQVLNVRGTDLKEIARETLAKNPNQNQTSMEGKVFESNFSTSKLQNGEMVTKEVPKTEVLKESIFDQILGKAKVTLSKDKSEMELQLKPESLGKMTLKIVTEKGNVVAKFVAENHQVKQLIELGLNELKEALENQGIKLTGFQVDVGNPKDHKEQNGSEKEEGDGTKKTNHSEKIQSRKIDSSHFEAYDDQTDWQMSQYSRSETAINLTA